jgi:hypothetical protein
MTLSGRGIVVMEHGVWLCPQPCFEIVSWAMLGSVLHHFDNCASSGQWDFTTHLGVTTARIAVQVHQLGRQRQAVSVNSDLRKHC